MNWRRNLWTLSICVFIANIGFNMFLPYLSNILIETGMNENISFWTGVLVSSSFLTGGLMAPVWGSLSDRYGKRVMLARSGYGLVVTGALMAFASSHWQLLFYRTVYGLLSGFIPASIMLIVSNTPQDKMGFALGTINSFVAIGSIMGPFVGGALVQYIGVRNNMLVSAGILLLVTTVAVLGTKEKLHAQTEKTTVFQDLQLVLQNRMLKVFFISMVVLNISTFLFVATLPLRIGEMAHVHTDLITGVMFSLTGIAMALGSMALGRMNGFSYVKVLLTGLVLSGLLCFVQGITGSLYVLGVTRFLFGLTNASVNVAGNVLITLHSKVENRGRVFGVLNSFTAFGGLIGPLLGGILGEYLGLGSSFYACAMVFLFAGLITWFFTKGRQIVNS